MKHFARRGAAVAAALALFAVSCGDEPGDAVSTEPAGTEAPPETGAPTETEAPLETDPPVETEVPAETEPADEGLRIVSLSPTHTEMLFAMDAGGQVVAVDDQSDYPEEALTLPNNLSGFEPNVEAIASFEPDLVITGGDFTGLGEQLGSLGIDTWDGPAAVTIDDTYQQILELGDLTGETENADALVAGMRSDVEALVASAPVLDEPLAIYHELDPSLYSVTSSTFIGQVYGMVGLRNVADELETDAGPYPQLNAEFLVSANPDLVFLADTECCGESVESVSKRPGWDAITAVQNGDVYAMNEDLASRWGPRSVEYLADVVDALHQVAAR